jgi:hypothetical protein
LVFFSFKTWNIKYQIKTTVTCQESDRGIKGTVWSGVVTHNYNPSYIGGKGRRM